MGKARFFCLLLSVLIPAANFLLSGVALTETDDGIKNQESYYLSDDKFFDGKALIDLPFGIQLFDLNVTRVAVTKEGTIQSADPSVNWTIAPLNAKSGMSHSSIYYQIKDETLDVYWIEFHFKHENFEVRQFRFKVKLRKNGEIKIRYQEVPYNLKNLPKYCDYCLEDKFGVMYSYQEEFKVAPYKETYELGLYLDFEEYRVQRETVIQFSTADWCMFRKNCYDCTKTMYHLTPNHTVQCSWCPAIEKCSNTSDNLQHVWMEYRCNDFHVNETNYCGITFKVSGDSWFYYCLPAGFIVIAAIMFIIYFSRSESDEAVFCGNKPPEQIEERTELMPSTNQPSQSCDNIAAETQDNPQKDVDASRSKVGEAHV